jgi:hypothetical protein
MSNTVTIAAVKSFKVQAGKSFIVPTQVSFFLDNNLFCFQRLLDFHCDVTPFDIHLQTGKMLYCTTEGAVA